MLSTKIYQPKLKNERHDTQHNDIHHNDNQPKVIICDTQHKGH